jgi:hypothetical protein
MHATAKGLKSDNNSQANKRFWHLDSGVGFARIGRLGTSLYDPDQNTWLITAMSAILFFFFFFFLGLGSGRPMDFGTWKKGTCTFWLPPFFGHEIITVII